MGHAPGGCRRGLAVRFQRCAELGWPLLRTSAVGRCARRAEAGGYVVNGGGGEEEMSEHTQEQGLRVHHLVNLGGLIAVAGLDREPPDFLLGALVSVARERDQLTAEQRMRVASLGRQ